MAPTRNPDLDGSRAPKPPAIDPGWAGFRGIDRAIVLERVSSLLADGASSTAPAELLTSVSEAAAPHLALTTVVLFKRVAGQSRTLAWVAPGLPASRHLAARARAWTSAADLVEHGGSVPGGAAPSSNPRSQRGSETASVSVEDAALGLSVLLYVESRRPLDGQDRWLLEEILRRMLGMYPRITMGAEPPNPR